MLALCYSSVAVLHCNLCIICWLHVILQSPCFRAVVVSHCSLSIALQFAYCTAVFMFHCSLHVSPQSLCCSAVCVLHCSLCVALRFLCCSHRVAGAVVVLYCRCRVMLLSVCNFIRLISRFPWTKTTHPPLSAHHFPFHSHVNKYQEQVSSQVPRNKIYTKYQIETFLQLPGINYLPESIDIRKA